MLEMVNLGGHRLKVNYLDMEAMSAAEPGSEELRVFQQLQDGTNVVGGVIPTQEANDFTSWWSGPWSRRARWWERCAPRWAPACCLSRDTTRCCSTASTG